MSSAKVTGIAVAVLAVVGVGVWWAMQQPPAEAPATRRAGEAVVNPMSPVDIVEMNHRERWPYGSFEQDLNVLKAPPEADDVMTESKLQLANELKIMWPKVRVDFADATPAEVVAHLQQVTKDTGVKVLTYPDLLESECGSLRFTVSGDYEVHDLIDVLRGQSAERFRYYVTSQGLYLGGTSTIQQCQMDAREVLARRRAEPERKSTLLDVPFRPDFPAPGWGIAKIHRAIREQTNIEVIVDGDTWLQHRVMAWTADPMPLRDALDEICDKLGCVFRVRDGRVFILKP